MCSHGIGWGTTTSGRSCSMISSHSLRQAKACTVTASAEGVTQHAPNVNSTAIAVLTKEQQYSEISASAVISMKECGSGAGFPSDRCHGICEQMMSCHAQCGATMPTAAFRHWSAWAGRLRRWLWACLQTRPRRSQSGRALAPAWSANRTMRAVSGSGRSLQAVSVDCSNMICSPGMGGGGQRCGWSQQNGRSQCEARDAW